MRAAGVPYTVVRATGLTTEDEDLDFLLEARQGDAISGKVSRAEVAQIVANALGNPCAAGVLSVLVALLGDKGWCGITPPG